MEDEVFYAYPQRGTDEDGKPIFDKTHYVAAKFLIVNGHKVGDPNPKGSMYPHIYRRLNANGSIDEASIFSNTKNYLVVPANYDPSEALEFDKNGEQK